MFDKDILENDKHLINLIAYKLSHTQYQIGRFIDIHTVKQFIDKLLKANFEEVKYLPKSQLHMYRTSDLGFGYSNYISPARLHELIELGKVPKDISIHFKYKHGNIFTTINKEDIDINLLLTDDIYFLIKKDTSQIWNMYIGKPTNPNYLYYKSDLDKAVSTLYMAKTVEGFNRVEIYEKLIADFI